MIDYKSIIDNLSVEKVKELLLELGAGEVKETVFGLIAPTICHNTSAADASQKLYYYANSHLFQCYTECGSMTIFKFLEHYYEARDVAYDWHRDVLEVAERCSKSFGFTEGFTHDKYRSLIDNYAPRKIRRELPSYPEGLLDIFIKKYPVEWERDNISHTAMDKFNIKYSISQNKIIIPHYDAAGRLVGIRGRALNKWEEENVGKYMPVQIEKKWYSHPLGLNLYGLNVNKHNIKKYGICYIFESEKSSLQAESFSFPNCSVACCGSNINKLQIDLLMQVAAPREIVVCFDREEKEGENKYFEKLYNMCKKYINYATISFIYDRKGISPMKSSPSDNGEEMFKELLRSRVYVR